MNAVAPLTPGAPLDLHTRRAMRAISEDLTRAAERAVDRVLDELDTRLTGQDELAALLETYDALSEAIVKLSKVGRHA